MEATFFPSSQKFAGKLLIDPSVRLPQRGTKETNQIWKSQHEQREWDCERRNEEKDPSRTSGASVLATQQELEVDGCGNWTKT